jgi:hypothetical protein
MPPLTRAATIVVLLSFVVAPTAKAADPGFAVDTPVGQATGSTGQSYVLAVALAFKRDKYFPVNSLRGH